MTYRIADGFDNAAGLTALVPQPRTLPGIETARRVYTPTNAYPDGEQTVRLVYNVLTNAEKNTLDSAFGVSETALMNEVTVRIKRNDSVFAVYNARVEYPEIGKTATRSQHGWENVIYIVHLVEAL